MKSFVEFTVISFSFAWDKGIWYFLCVHYDICVNTFLRKQLALKVVS